MTSPTAIYSASVPSASVVCSCCLGAVLCNSIDSISSGLWGTVQGSWAFFHKHILIALVKGVPSKDPIET